MLGQRRRLWPHITKIGLTTDVFSDYRTAVQSQKALSAYFTSEQIVPFGFAEEQSSTFKSGLNAHHCHAILEVYLFYIIVYSHAMHKYYIYILYIQCILSLFYRRCMSYRKTDCVIII